MATAYHQEALRKQRILERKQQAAARLEAEQQGIFHREPPHQPNYSSHTTECGHRLDKFRVNEEGFKNRYRNRAHMAPHVDRVYKVLYDEKFDNIDYVVDEYRNTRIYNRAMDKYEAERVLNGQFHVQVREKFPL